MRCNQCEMLSINGTPCHETGCPNSRKDWDEHRQEWIQYVDCFECGCPVEVGEVCGCQEPFNEERWTGQELARSGAFVKSDSKFIGQPGKAGQE